MSDKIYFVDQTIRDAQQSIWGNMMSTDMIVPVAETMDQVGYRDIATVGSQAFTVQVRNLGEDPWERIRKLSGILKNTPLRGSYQIGSLSSFDLGTPRDIISLWIKRNVANGVKGFWICDYQDEQEKYVYFARIAKELGAEIITSIMFATSPYHTEAHWAEKIRRIAETKEFTDRIMIEDASGVITPEQTRALVKVVRKHCDGIPIEFHGHCNSGLAIQCYLEAIQEGVATVHTAVAPLANATSLPCTGTILKNARKLGFTSDINEDALAEVTDHFRQIAENEDLPTGVPMEYDLFHFEHQVPGGMTTNLQRQLSQVGMADRFNEIMDEVVRVRKEFGYPVMATPFSQIVGAQAVDNVVSGERYKNITDASIKLALGCYGELPGPMDTEVMKKIEALPRTRMFKDWTPEGYLKSVEEIRSEIGPELSDDDLLLKYLIPGKFIGGAKPTRAAGKKSSKAGKKTVPMDLPTEFNVDVDGEVYTVKVSPVWGEDGESGDVQQSASSAPKASGPVPEGAVMAGMAGLVVSIKVKVGDKVEKGDLLAEIEAMKMMRNLEAPHSGVVGEIYAQESEIINAEDVFMVVNEND